MQSKPLVIGSKSIKTIKVDPRELVKIAREHSLYHDAKWGGVPSDATLISVQRKESQTPGEVFHIIRLRCQTNHPEQLPLNPNTHKPAENLYLFRPGEKEVQLLKEVHRRET